MKTLFSLNRWRLFSRLEEETSPAGVIRWWEMRRMPYNLAVGAAGLFTIAVIVVVDLISERKFGEPLGLPDPPIFAVIGIIAYGVIANVCYTGGWIAELIARRVRKGGSAAFALTAFSRGLMFSLFLTLSPALLFAGILCVRILRR